MPIESECLSCQHRLRLPDRANGESVQCPHCFQYFVATPAQPLRKARIVPPSRPAPPPDPIHDTAPQAEGRATVPENPPLAPHLVDGPDPSPLDMIEPTERDPEERAWVDPIGLGAILFVVAALVAAQFTVVGFLVIPLGLLALLIGGAALLLAPDGGKSRFLGWVATSLAGISVFAAVFIPTLLGPTYEAWREADAPDPTEIRVVPLPRFAEDDDLDDPEWVDASRAALRQGNIVIQVESVEQVTPRPAEPQAPPPIPADPYLRIRLRVQRVGDGAEFGSETWVGPNALITLPQPTLTDSDGNTLQAIALDSNADDPRMVRKSTVFPVALSRPEFAFDLPPPGVEFLRLELPVEAWGGIGAFRFTLPGEMIRPEPVMPNLPGFERN